MRRTVLHSLLSLGAAGVLFRTRARWQVLLLAERLFHFRQMLCALEGVYARPASNLVLTRAVSSLIRRLAGILLSVSVSSIGIHTYI